MTAASSFTLRRNIRKISGYARNYLLPRSLRPRPKSRRNEPCHLGEIASAVALASGRPLAQVVEDSTQVALRFFQQPVQF